MKNTEDFKQISGATPAEVWQQVAQDLKSQPELLQYSAILNQGAHSVVLDIDIDLGGGFESGFATTILSARFANPHGLSFAVYPQHFTDGLGKLFGMQDVVLGYPDFDEKLIVKGTHENLLPPLFADATVRQALLQLTEFTFEINLPDDAHDEAVLELFIEEGITNPARLEQLYHAFVSVLDKLSTLG